MLGLRQPPRRVDALVARLALPVVVDDREQVGVAPRARYRQVHDERRPVEERILAHRARACIGHVVGARRAALAQRGVAHLHAVAAREHGIGQREGGIAALRAGQRRGRVGKAEVGAQGCRQRFGIGGAARLLQADDRAAAKLLGDGPGAAAHFGGIARVVGDLVAALPQPLEIEGAEGEVAFARRCRLRQPHVGGAIARRYRGRARQRDELVLAEVVVEHGGRAAGNVHNIAAANIGQLRAQRPAQIKQVVDLGRLVEEDATVTHVGLEAARHDGNLDIAAVKALRRAVHHGIERRQRHQHPLVGLVELRRILAEARQRQRDGRHARATARARRLDFAGAGEFGLVVELVDQRAAHQDARTRRHRGPLARIDVDAVAGLAVPVATGVLQVEALRSDTRHQADCVDIAAAQRAGRAVALQHVNRDRVDGLAGCAARQHGQEKRRQHDRQQHSHMGLTRHTVPPVSGLSACSVILLCAAMQDKPPLREQENLRGVRGEG